jgi:hypothetical protein
MTKILIGELLGKGVFQINNIRQINKKLSPLNLLPSHMWYSNPHLLSFWQQANPSPSNIHKLSQPVTFYPVVFEHKHHLLSSGSIASTSSLNMWNTLHAIQLTKCKSVLVDFFITYHNYLRCVLDVWNKKTKHLNSKFQVGQVMNCQLIEEPYY